MGILYFWLKTRILKDKLGEEILSKVVLKKEEKKTRVRFLDEKQTYGLRTTKGMRGFP
jgi:hypothetical protein